MAVPRRRLLVHASFSHSSPFSHHANALMKHFILYVCFLAIPTLAQFRRCRKQHPFIPPIQSDATLAKTASTSPLPVSSTLSSSNAQVQAQARLSSVSANMQPVPSASQQATVSSQTSQQSNSPFGQTSQQSNTPSVATVQQSDPPQISQQSNPPSTAVGKRGLGWAAADNALNALNAPSMVSSLCSQYFY